MEYKEQGVIPRHYGGPYNHNTEGLKEEREDYVPKEPVSQRFGELQTGNRRANEDDNNDGEGGADATGTPNPDDVNGVGNGDDTDRSYRTMTKHSEINGYVDNPDNNVTKPDRWDQMNLDDKKGWLDENT